MILGSRCRSCSLIARNTVNCFILRAWSADFRLPRPRETILVTVGWFFDSRRWLIEREKFDSMYRVLVSLYIVCS